MAYVLRQLLCWCSAFRRPTPVVSAFPTRRVSEWLLRSQHAWLGMHQPAYAGRSPCGTASTTGRQATSCEDSLQPRSNCWTEFENRGGVSNKSHKCRVFPLRPRDFLDIDG